VYLCAVAEAEEIDVAQAADADQGSGSSSRAPGAWFWAIAGITYLSGCLGYWLYLKPGTPGATSGWNVPYYALQLFTLNFVEVPDTPVPVLLHIVRIVAPAVTVLAATLTIVGERVGLWWRRTLRRGYTLVVGETAEAHAVANALRTNHGRRVHPVENGRFDTLRRAGVGRARTVYVLDEDDSDGLPNVASALAAATFFAEDDTRVFVHVKDSELALGLRARDIMTDRTQALEYFVMDEVAARAYVEADPLGPDARPEILVAGAGAFGRAMVVAFARNWRAVRGPGERVAVTLIDKDASGARALLRDRWQIVDENCDITAIDTDDLAAALKVASAPYRAYICYDDEQQALRSALSALPLWHGGPGSLVVRLNELSEHAVYFPAGPLFDDLGGRLRVANVAALAGPYVAQEPDLFVDVARSIHARYLADQLRKGEKLGDRPALAVWAKLDKVFQDSNIDQARHLTVKLKAIGASVAPRSTANPRFELTQPEVELLAPMEHERWVRDRTRAGWRHAAETDPKRKRSKDMVPWAELREESRDKDREAVRGLETTFADALADIGLQIVRL
jgi:hypothetical protein